MTDLAPRSAPEPPPRRRKPASSSAKASFLRMVSHELRTPLNAIIGFSEILGGELYGPIGSPRYKEYAGIIHDSGHKLLKLVNQILEVVRLEDHAAELDLGPQGVEHSIDDVVQTLGSEIAARKAEVEVADRAAMPWALADGRALRTILSSLVQNALQFGGEAPHVTLRARRTGDRVEIEVEDRGDGIPLEDIPRVMKPFEQGGAALTRRSEGAGLGLTIARLLAEAMGGALRLDSRPGEGLKAVLVLPAAQPAARAVAAARRSP